MALLNKQQIFSAQDRKYQVVDVPEWKGQVRLRSLSIGEQVTYEEFKEKGGEEMVLRLLSLSCVDEQGNPLFSSDDLDALKDKSPLVLCDLFKHALELNYIREGELAEKAKN